MNPVWSKQIKPQPQPLRPLFEDAAEEGYDMVEWRSPTVNGITVPETDLLERPDSADEIRALSDAFRIAMAYHAPQGPLWHFGVLPFPEAVARLQESVRRASAVNAGILTFHLGIAVAVTRIEAIRQAASVCRAVAPFAQDHGVCLCVENVFDEHSVATVEECEILFEAAADPRLRLTLDTGHAHLCGCLYDMVETLGDRLAFTHIHDNDLSYDTHLVPGNGTIDWKRIIAGLDRAGYTGPLNFELREDAALPDLKRIWEEMATPRQPA